MGDSSAPAPVGGFHGTRRFRRVMRRGAGGMGVVYEVIDGERGLRLALKTLPFVRPDGILRLKQEFRTLRDLSHPNLVQLHELVFEEGLWFFTMELVEGTDLLSFVRPFSEVVSARALDEGRVRSSLAQLASALRYLHRHGIVHCDVKPSNVLVTPQGRVVVLDFGLAVDAAASAREDDSSSGTPAYMAPEQVAGSRLTAATDAYAVGALLHEALTGHPPFLDDDAESSESKATRSLLRRPAPRRGPPPPLTDPRLPSDLILLRTRLLALDPSERPDDDEVLRSLGVADGDGERGAFALPSPTDDAFVGRREEQEAIGRALEAARGGAFVAVAVQGVSGIGKSALVRRAVQGLAEGAGARVFRGRCHEREALPFKAFDGIIDDLVRHLVQGGVGADDPLSGPGNEALAQLFPTVGALGVTVRTVSPEDEQWKDARALAFGALKSLLAAVAAKGPLVLVADDAHWADGDSVALLTELARPPSPPLLLLLTARPTDRGPCRAITALGAAARVLDLGGLGRADLLSFVGSHASTHQREGATARGAAGDGPSVDVDALLEESEGHPMFVEELLRSAVRERPRPEGSRVSALDDALRARASALGDHARRTLEAIAAAGEPTPLVAVREGAGLRADHFAAALRQLEQQRLARSSGTGEAATAEPYHDRVREAVYARLDEETRRGLHERLAWGLGRAGAPPEVLVHHFRLGGNTALAGRYAKEAATRMEAVFAYDRAAAFWSIALASAPRSGPARTELLVSHGRALGRAGRPKEAADAFLAAAAMEGVTAHQRFELERRAMEQLLCAGYMIEGLALCRDLMGEVGLSLPEGKLAAVASLLWHQWRSRKVPLDLPRDADVSKEDEEAEAKRFDVRWTVGTTLAMVAAARGQALLAAGLKGAMRRGDSLRRARALAAACFSEAGTGDPARARALAEAAAATARADGGSLPRVYALLAAVAVLFYVDVKPGECVAPLLEAEALWLGEGRDAGWETATFAQYICWCLWWSGDLVALRERWDASVRMARLGGHLYLETALRVGIAWVHLMDDRPGDADADAGQALALWAKDGREDAMFQFWRLETRTWTWLYGGGATGGADLWASWAAFDGSLLSRLRVLRAVSIMVRLNMATVEARRAHLEGDERAKARALGELWRWKRRYWDEAPSSRESDAGPGAEAVERLLAGDREGAVAPLRTILATQTSRNAKLLHAAWSVLFGDAIGGAEGDAIRAEALHFFSSQGVRRPEAFAHMLVPMRCV